MTDEVKKRGRKKGSKTGPRAIIYIAVGKEATHELRSRRYSSTDLDLTAEDIQTQFEIEFKDIENVSVWGPFYDVKGLSQSKPVETKEVVSLGNLELGNPKGTGSCEGWFGLVFEIKNKPDMLFFLSQKEITPSGKKLPAGKAVLADKIDLTVV